MTEISKIGFVFTNFNNAKITLQAVDSIVKNTAAIKSIEVSVVIVDNASSEFDASQLRLAFSDEPHVHLIINKQNVGYFDGLNIGIDYLNNRVPDVKLHIIGNNDLIFSLEFFEKVIEGKVMSSNDLVICPDIINLNGLHQNPHVFQEISRFRELVWDLYYSNYALARLVLFLSQITSSFTKRKDQTNYKKSGYILRGFGACYILTPTFFRYFKRLWSPSFLDNEEFFLCAQLRSVNKSCFYNADISVFHHDKASTSMLPDRTMWQYSKDGHRIYRNFVSPYRWKMWNEEKVLSIKDKMR
jgi:GT2 family glycosyltransferase